MDVVDRSERHPAGPDDVVGLDVRGRGGASGGDQVTARVDGPAERFAAPIPEAAPPPVPTLRSAAARRRTSRRSLVLGVLVVLLGGLMAFAAGRMLTAQTEVLAVAPDVPPGSTITADPLTGAHATSEP